MRKGIVLVLFVIGMLFLAGTSASASNTGNLPSPVNLPFTPDNNGTGLPSGNDGLCPVGNQTDENRTCSQNAIGEQTGSPQGALARYPIMRPDPETRKKWFERYKASPEITLKKKGKYPVLATGPRITGSLPTGFLVGESAAGGSTSLLDHLSYVPGERNQGYCGNCWAWAGTGVMEIANDVQNGALDRLSVQFLNSNYHDGGTSGSYACCGGWLSPFADFYSTSKKMTIPWANTRASWQDGGTWCGITTSVPAHTISTTPSYNITKITEFRIGTQGVGNAQAVANIKSVLDADKGIWFAFFLPNNAAWNEFFSFWDTQPETAVWNFNYCGTPYNQGGGHAVLVVGYNDTQPNNAYWTMLNSWGTAGGNRPNGLFRVNMSMNYNCANPGLNAEAGDRSLYWQTLNITYTSTGSIAVTSTPSGAEIYLDSADTGHVTNYTIAGVPTGNHPVYVTKSGYQTPVPVTVTVSAGQTAAANFVLAPATVAVPTAGFITNVTSGNAPLAVKFTDRSTGLSLNKWNWSFGDGTWFNTTSVALKNPAHIYGNGGTYNARLTVCNTSGCNTTAPAKTITVTTLSPPVANFTTNVTSGKSPLAVKFTDTSIRSPTKWNWSFGDGTWFNTTLVAQKNPAHIYGNGGTYTAKLTACNAAGCNTTIPGRAITVTSLVAPVANFTTNVTSGNSPLAVKFTDTSIRAPTKWNWSFGDGTWFNTTVAAQKSPAHVYSTGGTFTAKLTACNAAGCNTTIPGRTITISTLAKPIVSFITNRTSGAAPLPIKFIDRSTGSPTEWRWGFGDGTWFNTTSVALKNPAHTYTVPGSYPSRLIACNAAGCNTTAPVRTITVT